MDTIKAKKPHSLSLTLAGFLIVLALTFAFIHWPLIFITVSFYLFLTYFLVVNSKAGIIFLALSFPLVRNSFAAITGSFMPILFYGVFIAGIMALIYGNVLGFKLKIPPLMMDKYLLILTVYIFFSIVVFSSEKAYGMEKLKYLLMNIILFYLTILLVKDEFDLEQVFKAVFYFGVFFTIFSLLSYLDLEPFFGNELAGRFAALGMNPIWMARYFSYAILIELYFILKYLPEWHNHLGKLVLLTVLILVQLYFSMLTGSRGPLAAMLFALVCTTFFHFRKNFKLSYLIGVLLLIASVFAVAISFVPAEISQRLLSQDVAGQSTTMIRLVINIEALFMFWSSKIFGIGFGGFNMIFLKYPHNIMTEVLSELGLIGFTLLIAIFVLAIKYLIAIAKKIDLLKFYFILTILLASFANANLSGHLGSNFFFFFSLSLIYAARQIGVEENRDES